MTMMFGPSLDAELAYRRERLAGRGRRRSFRRSVTLPEEPKRTSKDDATQLCEDVALA